MKKKKQSSTITVNRRAAYDYSLGEDLTVGMSLNGSEVRSIRDHHVQLKGSFVTIRNRELWLNNLTLGAETARNIRLLATKKQIRELEKMRDEITYEINANTKEKVAARFIPLVFGDKRFNF